MNCENCGLPIDSDEASLFGYTHMHEWMCIQKLRALLNSAVIETDLRSMWIIKPSYGGRTSTEFNGIHVDCCIWPDGQTKWAIRSGERDVLDKEGDWIFEPNPSSRTDEYFAQTRFDTLSEAIRFAHKYCEKESARVTESQPRQ